MRKRFRRHLIHKTFIREVSQLRRILIGMGIGPEEGEDLLQDVYVEAMERPPEDRGKTLLAKWLIRVTVNRAKLQFRRKQIHQRGLDAKGLSPTQSTSEPSRLAALEEETAILERCLSNMQETLRIPLVLRHCSDLNATEIGEVLNIKPGTVRKRLCAGRVQLAEMLTNRGITS